MNNELISYMVLYLFLFVTGASIGSFLGVCIDRIPNNRSIVYPPSACDSCGTRLNALDMVPILSAVLLGFRCRYCGVRFPKRMVLLETLTGIAYMFVVWTMGVCYEALYTMVISSVLIVVSFTDIDHRKIPNKVLVVGSLLAVCFSVCGVFLGVYSWSLLAYRLLYAVLAFLVIAFCSIVGQRFGVVLIGMGDAKLFFFLGLLAGKGVLFVLSLGIVFAGVYSVILLILQKVTIKCHIPMAPFFALSFFSYLYVIESGLLQ